MGAGVGGCNPGAECAPQESCTEATRYSHELLAGMRQTRVTESLSALSKSDCQELRSMLLEGPVTCMSFSPAADLLVAGGQGGGLTVFDADSWVPIQRLDFSRVSVVRFLPSGEYLVLGDDTAGLVVYDTARWCQVIVLESGSPIHTIGFLGSSKPLMVAGGEAHAVKIFSTKSWELVHTLECTAGTSSLSVAAWDDLLAVGDRGNKLTLYDTSTWTVMEVWQYVSPVQVVLFSPGRRFLVAGTSDGEVIIYSVPGLQRIKSFEHGGSIATLSFSGMGTDVGSLAVGDHAGQLSVYDTGFDWCSTFDVSTGCPVLAAEFSPRGDLLIVGDAEWRLTVYDPAERRADSVGGLGSLAPACYR